MVVGPESAALFQGGSGTAAQVGGSADQVGNRCGNGLKGQAGGLPGGQLPRRRGDRRQSLIPALRKSSREPLPELGGQIRVRSLVRLVSLLPLRLELGPPGNGARAS